MVQAFHAMLVSGDPHPIALHRPYLSRLSVLIKSQIAGVPMGASPHLHAQEFKEIGVERDHLTRRLPKLESRQAAAKQRDIKSTAEIMRAALADMEEWLTAPDSNVAPIAKNRMRYRIIERILPKGDDLEITLKPLLLDETVSCISMSVP